MQLSSPSVPEDVLVKMMYEIGLVGYRAARTGPVHKFKNDHRFVNFMKQDLRMAFSNYR